MAFRNFEIKGAEGVDKGLLTKLVLEVMEEAVSLSPEDVVPGDEGWVEGTGIDLSDDGGAYPDGAGEFSVLVYKEANEVFAPDGSFLGMRPGYTLTLWDGDDQDCWSFFAGDEGPWSAMAGECADKAAENYGRWVAWKEG